jgi:hypothetical protein
VSPATASIPATLLGAGPPFQVRHLFLLHHHISFRRLLLSLAIPSRVNGRGVDLPFPRREVSLSSICTYVSLATAAAAFLSLIIACSDAFCSALERRFGGRQLLLWPRRLWQRFSSGNLPWSLDHASHYFVLGSLRKQVDADLLSQLLPLLIQAFKHLWNFFEVLFIAFECSRGVYFHHFFLDEESDHIAIGIPNGFQTNRNGFKPTPVNKISQNQDEKT